jgi:hypothetical protein
MIISRRHEKIGKHLWPILSRIAGNRRIPSELPAREPASPNTCITLLTGGLLVRVQPEEPTFPGRIQQFSEAAPALPLSLVDTKLTRAACSI